MPAAEGAIGPDEADALLADLKAEPVLVLAVSGGPDSTALLHLTARWRGGRPSPRLVAVTVDHGLRLEAEREALSVRRLSGELGVEHATMRWTGVKPAAGLHEAARAARYRLLLEAARARGARRVVTAHTLDDQAETVLLRMARGSGLSGLRGMARCIPLDGVAGAGGESGVVLVRPLLGVPKTRLIATLAEAALPYADDPSNANERFARARLRRLMPALAHEGLTPRGLARLARRVQRSEAALEAVVDGAAQRLGVGPASRKVAVASADWRALPDEIALRLLGRAIAATGDEGPAELRKLEALAEALAAALAAGSGRFGRTLAGARVALRTDRVVIERAPARRTAPRRGH